MGSGWHGSCMAPIPPAQMFCTLSNRGATAKRWTKSYDWFASPGQRSFSRGCPTMLLVRTTRIIKPREYLPPRLSILRRTRWHFLSRWKRRRTGYPTNDISPAHKVSYSRIAAEAWSFYKTQNDFTDAQLKEFTETPARLIFGKSLVGGTALSDIFDSITPGPIAYAKHRGYEAPAQKLALELGGPWAFYH